MEQVVDARRLAPYLDELNPLKLLAAAAPYSITQGYGSCTSNGAAWRPSRR